MKDADLIKIGKIVMRELDVGGSVDYLGVRREVAGISEIPPMAIAFDGHIAEIKEKIYNLRAENQRLREALEWYANWQNYSGTENGKHMEEIALEALKPHGG